MSISLRPVAQGFWQTTVLNPLSNALNHCQRRVADEGVLRLYGLMRVTLGLLLIHAVTVAHVWVNPLLYPESWWTPAFTSFLLDWPDPGAFQWVAGMTLVSLVCLTMGLFTRWAGPVAFVGVLVMLCVSYSFGRINHNANSLPLLLLIMLFSDWGARYSLDAVIARIRKLAIPLSQSLLPQWPLWMFLGVLAFPYFTSGLFKVVKGHFLQSGFVSSVVHSKQILWELYGTVPAWAYALEDFVIQNVWVGDILAWITIFLELFFILACFSKTSRVFMVALAVAFHAGITITCKILFFEHMNLMFMLLVVSVLLWVRRKNGTVAEQVRAWFPDKPPNEAEAVINTRQTSDALWRQTWVMIAVSLGVFFLLTRLSLPFLPVEVWQQSSAIRALFPFPIESNFYLTNNDVVLAAIYGSIAATLLVSFTLLALIRAWHAMLDHPIVSPGTQDEFWLLYDGDCGFCQASCHWAMGRGASERVRFLPYQQVAERLPEWGLSEQDCIERAYLLQLKRKPGTSTTDPTVPAGAYQRVHQWGGAAAVNGVLRLLPGWKNVLYRLLSELYRLDGIQHLEDMGYRWVAKNRHRIMPGSTCSLKIATIYTRSSI